MTARQFLETMASVTETCDHPRGECMTCDQRFVFEEVAREMLMREDYLGGTDVIERFTVEAMDRWHDYFHKKLEELS